jgi:hypothetical protein
MSRAAAAAAAAVLLLCLCAQHACASDVSAGNSSLPQFAAASPRMAQDAPIIIQPSNPNLFYIGRWKDVSANTKTFDWGGSTIRLKITGTRTLGVALVVRAVGGGEG